MFSDQSRTTDHDLSDLPPRQPTADLQDGIRGGVAAGDVTGDGAVEETSIVSPRDPASGLATGKRQHKPFSL